jgi:hypothetical protein
LKQKEYDAYSNIFSKFRKPRNGNIEDFEARAKKVKDVWDLFEINKRFVVISEDPIMMVSIEDPIILQLYIDKFFDGDINMLSSLETSNKERRHRGSVVISTKYLKIIEYLNELTKHIEILTTIDDPIYINPKNIPLRFWIAPYVSEEREIEKPKDPEKFLVYEGLPKNQLLDKDKYHSCVKCNNLTKIEQTFPHERALCVKCSNELTYDQIKDILKPYSSPSGYCTPLEGGKKDGYYIRAYCD